MPPTAPSARRYWLVILVLPFASLLLAMFGYALLHGPLGLPEAQAGARPWAVLLEAVAWLTGVSVLEGALLLRFYGLRAGAAVTEILTVISCSTGRFPAMASGLAGAFLGFVLWREIIDVTLYSGTASAAFIVLAGLQAPLIAPLADMGEARLLETGGRR